MAETLVTKERLKGRRVIDSTNRKTGATRGGGVMVDPVDIGASPTTPGATRGAGTPMKPVKPKVK